MPNCSQSSSGSMRVTSWPRARISRVIQWWNAPWATTALERRIFIPRKGWRVQGWRVQGSGFRGWDDSGGAELPTVRRRVGSLSYEDADCAAGDDADAGDGCAGGAGGAVSGWGGAAAGGG